MKRIIVGALVALSFSVSAANNNNPPVNVNESVGSVQISQCASVGGNCNNASMDVHFNGNIDSVNINGNATVIKGADGANGKDGINGTNGKDGVNGKDGAKGQKGDKGEKGDAGASGRNGRDGTNGTDGRNGLDGSNGADGRNGKDGADGLNGKSVEVKDNGDGTVTLIGDSNVTIKQGSEYNDTHVKQSINNTNKRITSVERRVDSVERDVKHNRKVASKGVASAIAGSQIPQAVRAGGSLIGAGVGTYDGESAIAVGASHRFDNDKWTVKATMAATDSTVSFGAGVGYEW